MADTNKFYSLRWSGDRNHRIIKFRPDAMRRLLCTRDRVIGLYLECLRRELQNLTGRCHRLDSDQQMELSSYAKTIVGPPESIRDGLILDIIQSGIRCHSLKLLSNPEEFLDLLDYMVDNLLSKENTIH